MKIASVLEELGFDIQLLGSEKYVLNKLRTLKAENTTKVKEAFIRNKAPRFMKYFFPHEPYGKQKLYRKKLMKASLERLARLIKARALNKSRAKGNAPQYHRIKSCLHQIV